MFGQGTGYRPVLSAVAQKLRLPHVRGRGAQSSSSSQSRLSPPAEHTHTQKNKKIRELVAAEKHVRRGETQPENEWFLLFMAAQFWQISATLSGLASGRDRNAGLTISLARMATCRKPVPRTEDATLKCGASFGIVAGDLRKPKTASNQAVVCRVSVIIRTNLK